MSFMMWALALILTLGVGNFALHRALLDRAAPLAAQMPDSLVRLGGRLSLLAEFGVLLAALLLAANGWPELAWAYLAYSALNAMAAWFVLKRRM